MRGTRRKGSSKGALAVVAIALVAMLAATGAHGELSQDGNLRLSFQGNFSPRALPRDRLAPVRVHVEGRVGTTDGSRPPVLQRVEIELNRNAKLDFRGLSTCRAAILQSTTTAAALKRCRPALVGHGSFDVRIDFPGLTPIPALGKILAFNGRHGGRPALILQLYAAAPAQVGFVLPLTIDRRRKGRFGTLLSARLPILAGGSATVTRITLNIGRSFGYRGQRRSFLSASCSAPPGFPGAVFPLARGRFLFADGRVLSTALTRDCRVR